MDALATLIVALVGVRIAIKTGGYLLHVVAWALLFTLAVAVLTGVSVSGSLLSAFAVAWTGSQVVSRVRRGHWRSGPLAAVARLW